MAMLAFVSLPIELLRTRPAFVAALAVLTQAVLWLALPVLVYGSPPGELPELLAAGRDLPPGGAFGPPLALWAGELAFRAFGSFGVYLLSQICVAAALLALFALGRTIVGASHAAMAVLLSMAMLVFALPSPEFGPAVLSLPLWALLLLHVWLAMGLDRRTHWLPAGVMVGLLILTSYANLVLVALLFGFVAWRARGRAQFEFVEPYLGALLALLVLFPHLIWIDLPGARFPQLAALADFARNWLWLVGIAVAAHLGPAVLVLIARGLPGGSAARRPAPVIARPPVEEEGRAFVLFFALAPLLATLVFALLPLHRSAAAVAPLVLLSGLAIVMLLGDRVRIVHQRALVHAWAALLTVPAALAVAVAALAPSVGSPQLRTALPAAEMGRFFAAGFERRTGRPLAVVAGDAEIAALIALGARERPRLGTSRAEIEARGAVVVWRAHDTRGLPPPSIAAQLPGLVPEVPQSFRRRFQGFGQPLRLGWAVVRPRSP